MRRSAFSVSQPRRRPVSRSSGMDDSYVAALVAAIESRIAREKRDGVVSMSISNLKMLVHPPAGGPDGLNAPYYYDQLFRAACRASKVATAFTKEFGGR